MHYIIATSTKVDVLEKEGTLDFSWALKQLGLEEAQLVPVGLHEIVPNVVLFCEERAQYDQEGFAFRLSSDEERFGLKIFGPFIISALNPQAEDFFGLTDEQLKQLQFKMNIEPFTPYV